MGGSGSGWRGAKKATVEDGLILDIAALVRKQALVGGARTSGSWTWRYEWHQERLATIGYEADLTDQSNARL